MSNAASQKHDTERVTRGAGRRRSIQLQRTAAVTGALALVVFVAGCGGSSGPGSSASSSGGPQATALAYTRCMRSHGIHDFPDPTSPPGGGVTFDLRGGPASDLNRNNAAFQTASEACRRLLPGGQAPTAPAAQIAEEVKWAGCLRSHGVPDFPDPSRSGAIDSAKLNPTSPAFRRASAECKSVQPSGPVAAAPGAP